MCAEDAFAVDGDVTARHFWTSRLAIFGRTARYLLDEMVSCLLGSWELAVWDVSGDWATGGRGRRGPAGLTGLGGPLPI